MRLNQLFSILTVALLALGRPGASTGAQPTSDGIAKLTPFRYKDGKEMLQAFAPIATALRHSIVKLDVNGVTTALATVVDTNGLALTKASELKKGKLTSWIAGGREVPAELLASDEQSDLALVKINSGGLKPVEWAAKDVAVGQWTVTPGIETMPQAVGIISVPPRKILPKRAYLGVGLDTNLGPAKIVEVYPGRSADKAGLKEGDVVLSVNDITIKGREDMVDLLRTFREGDKVKLNIQRGEEKFEATLTLMPLEAMPGGRFLNRQNYMNRMGSELSRRSEDFGLAIQHDTVIEAWFCGGPLVNLDKQVIGINIARAGRVASYALPANLAREALDRLRKQAATK